MLGFSKKRFLVTLGLSGVIWYVTVIIQGITGYNAPFNLLSSGSSCQITGFPIAQCIYVSSGKSSVWMINLLNILLWFWFVHLFSSFLFRPKK